MSRLFEKHKEQLIEFAIKKWTSHDDMLSWVNLQSNEGFTKEEIYHIFLELQEFVQIDARTKNDTEIYDALADFMDGFTSWGKNFRILPNEPDL